MIKMKLFHNSVIAILLLGLVGCSTTPNEKHERPNILLIIVDDQGYADFEPFEHHDVRISTPNMSRLAEDGMVFTQAYTTAPVCSPSRAGLNTGKYQFRWDVKAGWGPGLPDDAKTIAEYLREAGYSTARIGKADFGTNYHNFDVREHPLNHGYDYFLGFSAHAHDYWLLSEESAQITPDPLGTSAHLGPLMENRTYKSYEDGYITDIFTDEAIKYLKNGDDQPFFLTLSYNAVHHVIHEVPEEYLEKYQVEAIHNYHPDSMETFGNQKPGSYAAYYEKYTRPGAIRDEEMRKFYLANLNNLDDNIGRVLDALKELNLEENTLVFFISDNGGSPLTGANNKPLSGAKYSLWEGGIRVPMAMRWPNKIEKGKVKDTYVSALDILPTIAEAVGFSISEDAVDGKSLFTDQPDSQRLLVWRWGKTWAVRKGPWKLTNANEQWGKGRPTNLYIKPISNDHSLKLFNLESDPGERKDLATEMPEKVVQLQGEYDSWVADNSGKY